MESKLRVNCVSFFLTTAVAVVDTKNFACDVTAFWGEGDFVCFHLYVLFLRVTRKIVSILSHAKTVFFSFVDRFD